MVYMSTCRHSAAFLALCFKINDECLKMNCVLCIDVCHVLCVQFFMMCINDYDYTWFYYYRFYLLNYY